MEKEDNSLSKGSEVFGEKNKNKYDGLVIKKRFFSNTLILSLIFIFIFGGVIAFVFYDGYFNKNPDLGDDNNVLDNTTYIESVDNTNDSVGNINNSNKPVNASNVKKSSTIVSSGGGGGSSGGSGDSGGTTTPVPDTPCIPNCSGKECGSDGCGGSCGSCASGDLCNSNWQCTNFSYLKIGIVNYATGYYKEPTKSRVLAWQVNHTDFFVSGASVKNFSKNNYYVGYHNLLGLYSETSDYYGLENFSKLNGYDFEKNFIHMNRDYTANYAWITKDKFDTFDNKDGILMEVNGALKDYTSKSYDSKYNDFNVSGNLFIGYGYPYSLINFLFNKVGDIQGEWYYWNGSWTKLNIDDKTNNLSINGSITFLPPSDWKRLSLNNSKEKYFVKFKLLSGTSFPGVINITGDNWLTNGKCRGWNQSVLGVINSGELSYNPNPPINSSAKFKYQSRATGYWAANRLFVNPAYKENGNRVWSLYRYLNIKNMVENSDYDGIMIDDLGGGLTGGVTDLGSYPENFSDFVEFTNLSHRSESLENFIDVYNKFHEDMPNKKIGGNTYLFDFGQICDFVLLEYFSHVPYGGGLGVAIPNRLSYDYFNSSNNPNGKIGILHLIDTVDLLTGNIFWDRSNRGPIAGLSSFLIGSNSNTYLNYYSEGGWRYDESDEIYVYNNTRTTLKNDLLPDNSTGTKFIYGNFTDFPLKSWSYGVMKIGENVMIKDFVKVDNSTINTTSKIYYPAYAGDEIKFVSGIIRFSEIGENYPKTEDVYRWANYFPAMFFDFGIPNVNGWNNGSRGKWNGFYRRDFTKAIILFNVAGSNTNKTQFESYSKEYELNGTYYSLRADGRFEAPITNISLRMGEGAILVKSEFTFCSNNFKDNSETDIDCGGICAKCENQKSCLADLDCKSLNCSFNICREKSLGVLSLSSSSDENEIISSESGINTINPIDSLINWFRQLFGLEPISLFCLYFNNLY
jgi:hypothetical protein